MEYNIYFDISAFFVYALMMFSVIYRKGYKSWSGRIFLGLIIIGGATALLDVLTVSSHVSVVTRSHFEYLYLFLHASNALVLCIYVFSVTGSLRVVKKSPVILGVLTVPLLVVAVVLIINLFNPGIVFSYVLSTETKGFYKEGYYYIESGVLKPLTYIPSFSYLLIALVNVIQLRKLFKKEKFISLLLIFPVVLSAFVVEFFFPVYLVEILFIALATLFLAITVERTEKLIDPDSGIKKYSAYVEDALQAEITKRKIVHIVYNQLNFNSLKTILSFDDMSKIKLIMAMTVEKAFKEKKIKADFYSHGNGLFSAETDTKYYDEVAEIAKKIRTELNGTFDLNHITVESFVNVTVFRSPDDISNVQSTQNFLDNFALTKNLFSEVYYLKDVEDKKKLAMQFEMESILERGLKDGHYEVYYQPIYNFKTKKFDSAEALLRLKDPEYGFIPPSVFIPAAEKNGLINPIGDFVLEEVCKFISSDDFERLGLEYIEVNLSTVQACNEKIVRKIIEIIRKYGVSPKKINLEITESADVYSSAVMQKNISRLKQCGFSFSLDDYGTGYSNIERILKLPLSIVKIDKSFVDSMLESKMSKVLKYTIKMVKSMDVEIVVEGVETKEALDMFEEYGCEHIQGYYFSKPLPLNDYVSFLEDRHLVC